MRSTAWAARRAPLSVVASAGGATEGHLGHARGLRRESHGGGSGPADGLQPRSEGEIGFDFVRQLDPSQVQGLGADDDQGRGCIDQGDLDGTCARHVEHVADAARGQQAAGDRAARLQEGKPDGRALAGDAVEHGAAFHSRAAVRDLEARLNPLV